jgi:hypothetical protein
MPVSTVKEKHTNNTNGGVSHLNKENDMSYKIGTTYMTEGSRYGTEYYHFEYNGIEGEYYISLKGIGLAVTPTNADEIALMEEIVEYQGTFDTNMFEDVGLTDHSGSSDMGTFFYDGKYYDPTDFYNILTPADRAEFNQEYDEVYPAAVVDWMRDYHSSNWGYTHEEITNFEDL